MPDIAVGPSTDITQGEKGATITWQILGGGLAICVSTDDPFARLAPERNLLKVRRTLLPSLFLPNAYASGEPPSSINNYGNTGSSATSFGPLAEVEYTHFLKVSLHGQIQYKVNDGDFQNWKSENFEGERYLRVATNNKTYRDALISPDGKIEIPIIFSFTSPPTLENFLWQMGHLVIYRTPSDANLNGKTEQKKCPPNSLCPVSINFQKMGPIIPDAPKYGDQPVFSALPSCPME